MIDMQGTFARPTASRSSRTPADRYCGSCTASPTRSYRAGRPSGSDATRKLARIELYRARASAHRQTHTKTFGVDEVGFRRQAHQPDAVPSEQKLGCQQ